MAGVMHLSDLQHSLVIIVINMMCSSGPATRQLTQHLSNNMLSITHDLTMMCYGLVTAD